MDDFKIYNRALEEDEILPNILEEDYGLDDNNLVGYWDFDNAPGNTLIDLSEVSVMPKDSLMVLNISFVFIVMD